MTSISNYCPKWHGFFVLGTILLLPVLFESCQSKSNPETATDSGSAVADTLPGDFVVFFDRFHGDSVYQMDHILFPLEGLPASTGDGDTLSTTRYFWQKADWKKHNHFTDPGRNFEQWYVVLNDRIIEHWIQMNGTNLSMKRRFAKLEDGWFLIYYQGMRPTDK